MKISNYLCFWKKPIAEDVALLLSEIGALRLEAAAMTASLETLHRHNTEAASALHDQIDGVRTHIGNVAVGHLNQATALRNDMDLRLQQVSDTTLAHLSVTDALRYDMDHGLQRVSETAQAQLSVIDALRDDMDLRLQQVSDIALVTLGEVVQSRPAQDDTIAETAIDEPHADVAELGLPPRDRHAMLILSSLL